MAQQHQPNTTVDHFFINCHVLHEVGWRHFGGRHYRQAGTLKDPNSAITLCIADPAQTGGHFQRHHGAGCHGFAMQPYAVTHMSFDGMAKGMAEVEGGTHARLALIGADHFSLGRARALNGGSQGDLIQRTQRVHVVFKPGQERLIANQAVLDNFGQPRRQFAGREGVEGLGIYQHQVGLIESTDHVFTQRVVDSGFTAHRRIDLGQQGSRHLDEINTALITGCGKTGHVTHHAAAQCNHSGASIVARREQAIENQLQGFPIFERFAIRQDNRHDRELREAASQTLKIEWRDR